MKFDLKGAARALGCAGLFAALPVAAQILTINQIDFPASIGRASDLAAATTPLDATVQVRYLRQLSAATVVRVDLPAVLQVAPPALPAGCQRSTVAGLAGIDCAVAAGAVGSSGSLSFAVRGRQLGGLSMTATAGTSSATRGGSVITAGNISHLLSQDVAGPHAAGATIAMSWRPTLDAAADDLPSQATIVLSDRLPGTATDFTLQAIDLSEAPGVSCDSVAQAQSSRTLVCRVSGPLTRAALGALRIRFSGIAGTSGSFVHQATVALQDGSPYLDAQPDDNVVTSAYTVDPAADLQAAIAFPSQPVLAGSSQTLTLTLSNNGPMTMPAGAQISLPLAAGFTVTSLPAGCSGVASGQTLSAAATLRCTAAALPQAGSQSWALGLRMPSAAATGTWSATALAASGWRDANAANDVASTLYTVSGAYADLGLDKTKLPQYGPVVPGTVVTTTITVRNEASSTAAATYTAAGGAQPLRVVDYLLPAEIDAAVGVDGLSGVSAGWTCSVGAGGDPANAARSRRVLCLRTAAGTLAPGESLTLSFSTQVSATMDGAPLLENRACTGETVLSQLGLGAAAGPQPPGNGQTANDCATAGGFLRATTATLGRALVALRQWSSTVAPVAGQDTATSADWHDDVAAPAVLAADQSTLYWRFEVATPAAAPQVTIPTLLVYNGSLPGLLDVSSPGAPAPGYRTPAITVTRELLSGSATLTGCPTVLSAGSGQLVCTLTQVAPGTRLRLTLAVPRPLAAGLLANTMAWVTSPDAFLSAVPGQVVDDDAAVQVLPRTDLALTSLSMAPNQPRIGQTVQFVATAQNLGPDEVSAPGAFTVIDDFNVDAAAGQAAYADLVASGEGMSCSVVGTAASGEPALAAGHRRVRCTNTTAVARYATRTVTVSARLLKPAGSLPASGAAWTAQAHTARVVLGGGLCEFKEETSSSAAVSSACGDAASLANNQASLSDDIGLPQIDLILGTQLVLPTGQSMPAIGQPLRYRFVLQNNGPSRAEGVTLQARLTLPTGFSVASPSVVAVNAQAVGAARYVLDATKTGAVTCALAEATLLSCRLAPQAADAWLAAGAEVNFDVELASTGSALVPVTYSQTSVVCADESQAGYESSGSCSITASADNNNRSAVNDTVFPATDLAITKVQVAGGAPASLNEPLAWDLGLRNRGPQAATVLRVSDVLPAGFDWLDDSAHAPALTLGSAVGSVPTLACSASPAALASVSAQQTVSCVISAPAGQAIAVGDDAEHQITLRLWARRRADWLQGPYGTAQLNTASVAPGVDAAGMPLAVDPVSANDSASASVVLQRAGLSGRVILDRNGNGVADGSGASADSPLEGVTVTVRGTDLWGATIVRSVRTAADGSWAFDHLPPGSYAVEETQPAGLVDSPVLPAAPAGSGAQAVAADATAGTGSRWTAITLAGGQSVSDLLFADTDAAARLAGRVWRDLDADGVADGDAAGETGIAGVTITLQRLLADGSLEAAGTATTGTDGRWSLGGLAAGRYRISEGALPAGSGLLDGRAVAGQVAGATVGTVTVGEPDRIDAVTLGADQSGTGYDFAEIPAAALGGRVWLDADGDGVVGATETGLAGVTLTLTGTDDRGQSVSRTTVTAADGRWSFSDLRPGTYAVSQSGQPAGTVNGVTRSALAGALAGNPAEGGSRITNLVLAAGQQAGDNLFGEQPNGASLAGRVWRDLDADGLPDGDAVGETGIAGITVSVQRLLADGSLEAAGTATTGADGRWSVVGLTAGRYRVSEGALPAGSGLLDGRAVAGQVAGATVGTVTAAEPDRIDAVMLGADQAGTGYDFAEIPAAALAGRVWLDADGDGLPGATEAGIADSRVRLLGTDDRGVAVDLEVRTDAQGQWRVDGLRPGRYRVLQPQQPTGTVEGAIVAGAAAAAAGAGGAANADGQSEIGTLALAAGATVDGLLFGERTATPDLRVTATASATTVTAGRSLTLTLAVANAGSVATSGNWSVSDRLPAGLSLAAVPTGSGWTCAGAIGDTAFSCSRSDSLAAGATLAAPLSVPVQVAATAAGTLLDAALVRGGGELASAEPSAAEQAALLAGGDPSTLTACTATPQHQACQLAITVRAPGAVSGTAWLDSGSVASRLDSTDTRLAGWTVELVDAAGAVVAQARTASDGRWRIGDLEPGLALQLRYREPASGVVFGWPVNGEQGTASADCLADADARAQGRASACVRSGGQPWSRIVVAPGAELMQQSLPVAAGGVVYDSTTRQPVAGARVSFAPEGSCAGFDPASQLVGASLPGGAVTGYTIAGQSVSMVTGSQGLYQFQFLPGSAAPAQCTFALSVQASGYASPSTAIPAESRAFSPVADDPAVVVAVQAQATAPVGGASTVWYATLAAGSAVATAVNNHLPLDPGSNAVLTLAKTGDRAKAEIGDSVRYTITVQRGSGSRPVQTTVVDRLPAGFTYVRGTASVNGSAIADPAGGLGPVLTFQLGAMSASGSDADRLVLRYRVRIDTGAQQGDGVNRAVAHGCATPASCVAADGRTPLAGASSSNEGRHTVAVGGGVFATEACLAGKVFVDCNHDHVQGAEELGIPGVRLILSDGTNLVSDVEGKYAVCGLAPRSHVLRVDETTLPRGSRLTTSGSRNLGDAGSLWLDLKHGELHRADVVEGSCSNTVLEQVKARRALGEVTAPQTERAGSRPLRLDSKAHGLDALRSPPRGTDGANQRVRPRALSADAPAPSEAMRPVPDLPMNRPPPQGRTTGDDPHTGDDDATR
ncbi:MAG: hypothetical protein RL223_2430 [Pseudomonadota bacterium]